MRFRTAACRGAAALALILSLIFPAPAMAGDDTALRLFNSGEQSTGYVRVPNHPAFALQTFTIEAWVQRSGTGYGFTTDPSGNTVVAKPREGMSGSNIASWHFYWNNQGQILFNLVHTVGSSGVYLSTPAVGTPLAPHHIAATFDGGTIRLYVDGTLAAEAPWNLGSVYYGPDDLLIGASNFSLGYLRRIDGFIDDVRLWSVARTADEIATYRNCRLTGNEPNLVAYWTFDDSDLIDETGHGHDGIPQGTAGAVTYGSLSPLGSCLVGADDRAPGALRLSASPLPARDRLTIHCELPRAGVVALELFDAAGRRRRTLAHEWREAGPHAFPRSLGSLESGVYFVRLRLGEETLTRGVPVIH